MYIPYKFPDAGAAGPGQCSENHCPKAVNELVLTAISYSYNITHQ